MITIRTAVPSDAARLLEIYSYYVEKTAVSFEYDVPTAEGFEGRIRRTLEKYPYLVAERDGRAVGYAYAGAFVGRAAYECSAELSIYLDKDERRNGAGRMLYEALEAALAEMGITNLYACIAVPPEAEDEYLNFDSMHFHEHMGFTLAGRFRKCGSKFGRRYDMIWMEKLIDVK